MTSKSKQKGTKGETQVVKFCELNGLSAERRALRGSKDEGDILVAVPDTYYQGIIEVKSGKQTANPNRTQLEEWWRQTTVEGSNAKLPAVLVVNRYNRQIQDSDVYFLYKGMKCHKYLDEFVDWLKEVARS